MVKTSTRLRLGLPEIEEEDEDLSGLTLDQLLEYQEVLELLPGQNYLVEALEAR